KTRQPSSRSAGITNSKRKSCRPALTPSWRSRSTSINCTAKPSVSSASCKALFGYDILERFDCAPVAQLDRVSDYESEGQRFESSRAYLSLPTVRLRLDAVQQFIQLIEIDGFGEVSVDSFLCRKNGNAHVFDDRHDDDGLLLFSFVN